MSFPELNPMQGSTVIRTKSDFSCLYPALLLTEALMYPFCRMNRMLPSLSTSFVCAAFAIALLFSFASVLPHILQRFDREYPFQGVEITVHDAEDHYSARVREIYDGNFLTSNVAAASPKDQAFLLPPLPELVIAGIGKLFFLDAPRALLFSKFYLAFALVLAMTGFLVLLTRRPWESLLAVTALLFVGALLGSPWDVKKWLFLEFPGFPPLRFTRPTSPLWHSTIFFGVLSLLSSWVSDRRRMTMVLASLLTSIRRYSSVFAWTYVGATMGVLFLWYLWKGEKVRIADMMIFLGVFLLLSLPCVFNYWETVHHPGYLDTLHRLGFIPRRAPMWSAWLTLFVIVSFFTKRVLPEAFPFVIALSVGGVIALNEHVLTGIFIMNHHYHWYFTGPVAQLFCVLFALVLLERFVPFSAFSKKCGVVALLLLGVSFGIHQQARAYLTHREANGREQQFAPLLQFLDERTKKGKVILIAGTDDPHWLILNYTSLELTGTKAASYLQTTEQLRDALFLDLWTGGLTAADAETRFFSDLRTLFGRGLHGIYYRELRGEDDYIPEEELQALVSAYRQYYELSLEEKIRKHALRYVLILPDAEETAALRSLRQVGSVIYEEGGYAVIELFSM